MLTVKQHPEIAPVLRCTGTPDELVRLYGLKDRDPEYSIAVAGFHVTRLSDQGKHDGKDALLATLADGDKEVGRLVVSLDAADDMEWELWFPMSDVRDNWLERFETDQARPKVSRIQLDLVFEPAEDEDELLAEWSSEYGISFTLIDSHGPGGGAPIYEVSGLTRNIERFLRGPYNADDDDVKLHLG